MIPAPTLTELTSVPTILASIAEARDRLDVIAADMGEAMAEAVYAPLMTLERDHRRFRERFSIGDKS